MNLIPEIKIGKHYTWRSFPIELLCPKCGYNMGGIAGKYVEEVVVLGADLDTEGDDSCGKCGAFIPRMEGWYVVRAVRRPLSSVGCVPYTHLEEIKTEEEILKGLEF